MKRHIFRSYSELTFDIIADRIKKYELIGIGASVYEEKWGIPRKTIYYILKEYDKGISHNMGKDLRLKFMKAINYLDREVERRINILTEVFEEED